MSYGKKVLFVHGLEFNWEIILLSLLPAAISHCTLDLIGQTIKKVSIKEVIDHFLYWISTIKDALSKAPAFIEEDLKDIVVDKLPHHSLTTNAIKHKIYTI